MTPRSSEVLWKFRPLNCYLILLWSDLDGAGRCFWETLCYITDSGSPVGPRALQSLGAELSGALQALSVTGGREAWDLAEGAAPAEDLCGDDA